jgi:peptide deformylase
VETKIVTDIDTLRRLCLPATARDDVEQLASTMFDVMAECHAQGLAANQIGANIRVIVMQVAGRSPICIVNPVMCLSC